MEANKKLFEESAGILARPTEKELVASISASHTTAFLNALDCGGKLPEGFSMEQLQHQGDDLQTMLSDGWLWTVISAKMEEEVPALLSFLQQAYNSDPAANKQVFGST